MTHNFEADNVLGFDTGLDSRAFAQAKFAQFIAEPGLIVRPDEEASRRIELWKASGVREVANADGKQTMMVWGPSVEGERLDSLLNNAAQDKALAAIVAWIKAILALKDDSQFAPPLWPCAATIAQEGEKKRVFFAPPTMTRLCTMALDESAAFSGGEWYVHPDLRGMDAAAFAAAAMLYRVFAGTAPYPVAPESADAADSVNAVQSLLHQDIREGNFLPIRFAVPGLNAQLVDLIQYAMEPANKKSGKFSVGNMAVNNFASGNSHAGKKGTMLLEKILTILQNTVSFVQPLAEEDLRLLEKEKAQFLKINTASVKTKRFVMRNVTMLLVCLAVLVSVIVVISTIVHSRSSLPTTAGMTPLQVVESYYNAIGELDHQLMEACVVRGAGKNDIGMVVNFFVISKIRQTHELRSPPVVVPALDWQQGNVELTPSAQIFGVTDLNIRWLSGAEDSGEIRYRADYILWIPFSATGEA
ncbi:MAG: hypothetical protein LBI06_03900, partial [Treponema sp.]|nr:hypothetical protein [Treponema sp.]